MTTEWQSIDSAPKDGDVLLWSAAGGIRLGWFDPESSVHFGSGWWSHTGTFHPGSLQPTHWHKLPEPPQ